MVENKNIKKLPISAVMVIRNEEKLIERAIQSFRNIVDEIIIIHDGKCEDKSLEIARRYTDKIFERPFVGQAERHRVFSYTRAKNDWLLQVDADEYLSAKLRENIEKLISEETDIFEISWSTFHKDKHHFWHYKRIIFKKSKVYFIGISHEGVQPIDNDVSVKKIDFPLYHEPLYDNCMFSVFENKWKKWAKIHAGQLLEDFSAIPKWNCPLNDWERHRRIRMKYPILLGMIATPAYHGYHSTKNFLKYGDLYFLKLGFFASLYHIHLYYYLNKYKKHAKSEN